MAEEIKINNKVKELAQEYASEINNYIEQWNKDWHKIDADKSNYINFHQYCEINDAIGLTAAYILQQSNDSINNHKLYTIILQGPEREYTTGTRFSKWLKKILYSSPRPERLRIVLDDKYCTDIDIFAIMGIPILTLMNEVLYRNVQNLIKKSQETNK